MKTAMLEKMMHDTGQIDAAEEIIYLATQIIAEYRVGEIYDFDFFTRMQFIRDYGYMLKPQREPRELPLLG